jgi:Cap4 SAVED domain
LSYQSPLSRRRDLPSFLPLAGEGQGGGRARLSALTLAALATGSYPMAQPQNRVSRHLELAGVLPAHILASVKQAPCRPVLLPVDRCPRAARVRIGNSARGHRTISEAAKSVLKALQHESIRHELELVHRHIDLTTLEPDAKAAILRYLDPFEEESNQRID